MRRILLFVLWFEVSLLLLGCGTLVWRFLRGAGLGYGPFAEGVPDHLYRAIVDHPVSGVPLFALGTGTLAAALWSAWNAARAGVLFRSASERGQGAVRRTRADLLAPTRLALNSALLLATAALAAGAWRMALSLDPKLWTIDWGFTPHRGLIITRGGIAFGMAWAGVCVAVATAASLVIRIVGLRSPD